MAKSAVLKPMPIASEATATSVNPGTLSQPPDREANVGEEGFEQAMIIVRGPRQVSRSTPTLFRPA